MQVDKQRYAIG